MMAVAGRHCPGQSFRPLSCANQPSPLPLILQMLALDACSCTACNQEVRDAKQDGGFMTQPLLKFASMLLMRSYSACSASCCCRGCCCRGCCFRVAAAPTTCCSSLCSMARSCAVSRCPRSRSCCQAGCCSKAASYR